MEDRPLRIRVRTDRPRAIASRLVATPVALAVRIDDDAVIVDTAEIGDVPARRSRRSRKKKRRGCTRSRGLDDDLESVFRYLVEARR